MHPDSLRRESLLIAAGRPARVPAGPVNQPIVLSSTFHAGGERVYGRDGNDTIEAFEAALGDVEGGPVTAFSSGMAASAALIEGLPVGAVVVLPTTFYNFNRTLLDTQVELGRLSLRPVDVTDTAAAIDALPQAALLWLELPTNPMLEVPDLPALTAAARQHGVRTVVDATLATPFGIRPLDHGADVVMHSATKWIAGHSDLVMGVLATADPALDERAEGAPQPDRRASRRAGVLSRAARPAHPVGTAGAGLRQRRRTGPPAGRASGGAPGALPGAARPPAGRPGRRAAGQPRRPAVLSA